MLSYSVFCLFSLKYTVPECEEVWYFKFLYYVWFIFISYVVSLAPVLLLLFVYKYILYGTIFHLLPITGWLIYHYIPPTANSLLIILSFIWLLHLSMYLFLYYSISMQFGYVWVVQHYLPLAPSNWQLFSIDDNLLLPMIYLMAYGWESIINFE